MTPYFPPHQDKVEQKDRKRHLIKELSSTYKILPDNISVQKFDVNELLKNISMPWDIAHLGIKQELPKLQNLKPNSFNFELKDSLAARLYKDAYKSDRYKLKFFDIEQK